MCFYAARRPGPRGAQFYFLSAYRREGKSSRPSHLLSYRGFKSTEYHFPLGKISAGRPIQAFLLGPPTPQSILGKTAVKLDFPPRMEPSCYPPALPHGERTDHNGFLVGEQGLKPSHNDG